MFSVHALNTAAVLILSSLAELGDEEIVPGS